MGEEIGEVVPTVGGQVGYFGRFVLRLNKRWYLRWIVDRRDDE
jgi:hypothetical protein